MPCTACCCTMLPALAESSGVDSGPGGGEGGGMEPECLSPGCPSPFLGSQHLPLFIQGLEAIVPRL